MSTELTTGYRSVIERAAADPDFDIDKLERLIVLQETIEQRANDFNFNEALAAAQSEMAVIRADANNPHTRSRYASYVSLYRECQPIYSKHNFSVSFSTEPAGDPNVIMVVGTLTNGPTARRYQVPMPIDTKGARGQEMMTRTHATLAACTYGKRHLLTLMFNLAVDTAAGPPATATASAAAPSATTAAAAAPPPPPPTPEGWDGKPFPVDWQETDTPRAWGEKFIACLRHYPKQDSDIAEFLQFNEQHLARLASEAPGTHRVLMASVTTIRDDMGAIMGAQHAR